MASDKEISDAVVAVFAGKKQCPLCKEYFTDVQLWDCYVANPGSFDKEKITGCHKCLRANYSGHLGYNVGNGNIIGL